MPEPKEGEGEQEFVSRCIPIVLEDGTASDEKQAAAVCYGIFREKKSIEEIKVGARHNASDREKVQTMHDYSVELGAACATPEKSLPIDEVVFRGAEVKAVKLDDGRVKLGGYLVRYGDPETPDITRDFFTPATDYGAAKTARAWFNHRLPVEFEGKSVTYKDDLGEVELTPDDIGIFAEIVMGARNQYEKLIAEWGLDGKLGWSSGTAPHLVDRKPAKNNTFEITRWPLGLDASLTPTQAEPRNQVISLKALTTVTATESNKESPMNEDEIKAMVDKAVAEAAERAATTAAEQAVKKFAEELGPEIKAGFAVTEVKDEADREAEGNAWKSAGEFFKAVTVAEISPSQIDKRLLPLKATGLNEAIPSQGGFLVPPQFSAGIREKMYAVGTLLSIFDGSFTPVTGNSMTFNLVDETSRADGSRFGGVRGYWLAEAGTKTSSRPTFNQAELKLKKVAALIYATDELLEDAAALESYILRVAPLELRFLVEDAIINGDGVGKPLGILAAGNAARKSAVRTDANEIDALDIGRMWAARFAGYNDYVWLGNQAIFPQLLNMSIGNQPAFMPANQGIVGEIPARLLGRPFYETEYNPALGTLGDLLLTSPSAYLGIQKAGGIQSASSIHVQFTTDETAFRFVYRVDGQPEWDSLLTLKDTNTVSPYVVLAATT